MAVDAVTDEISAYAFGLGLTQQGHLVTFAPIDGDLYYAAHEIQPSEVAVAEIANHPDRDIRARFLSALIVYQRHELEAAIKAGAIE
jgi:hypothetical protein